MADRKLTTGQVAVMTGHAPRTVCKWFDEGLVTGYRIPGSQDRRISERSVRALAEKIGMKLIDPPERKKGGSCRTKRGAKRSKSSPSGS